jgi:hypothetical protein
MEPLTTHRSTGGCIYNRQAFRVPSRPPQGTYLLGLQIISSVRPTDHLNDRTTVELASDARATLQVREGYYIFPAHNDNPEFSLGFPIRVFEYHAAA